MNNDIYEDYEIFDKETTNNLLLHLSDECSKSNITGYFTVLKSIDDFGERLDIKLNSSPADAVLFADALARTVVKPIKKNSLKIEALKLFKSSFCYLIDSYIDELKEDKSRNVITSKRSLKKRFENLFL